MLAPSLPDLGLNRSSSSTTATLGFHCMFSLVVLLGYYHFSFVRQPATFFPSDTLRKRIAMGYIPRDLQAHLLHSLPAFLPCTARAVLT